MKEGSESHFWPLQWRKTVNDQVSLPKSTHYFKSLCENRKNKENEKNKGKKREEEEQKKQTY